MHGQWDWMNDPHINSSTWDWDTASTPEAWKHSHNYVHHTYTNIRGKDRDLGYEIMRIDPHQKWNPVYLFQPFYNLLLAALLRVGRRGARPRLRRDPGRREVQGRGQAPAQGHGGQGAQPDREGLRRLAADQRAGEAAADLALGARKSTARRGPVRSPRRGARGRPTLVPLHAEGELHRQHRPQRVGLRDHLLRPLPRPDLHLQPGGGRGRDAAARGTSASCWARRTSRAARCST